LGNLVRGGEVKAAWGGTVLLTKGKSEEHAALIKSINLDTRGKGIGLQSRETTSLSAGGWKRPGVAHRRAERSANEGTRRSEKLKNSLTRRKERIDEKELERNRRSVES